MTKQHDQDSVAKAAADAFSQGAKQVGRLLLMPMVEFCAGNILKDAWGVEFGMVLAPDSPGDAARENGVGITREAGL